MILQTMKIAILALQGAFAEHRQMLQKIGVESALIRNLEDWQNYMQEVSPQGEFEGRGGLILPGGESTTMMRILRDEQLFGPIREAIKQGLPTFGTCAGMILLDDQHLGVMDITVRRNAYGRQLGSFYTQHTCGALGEIPMTFIRAPYIERVGEGVEVLSVLDGHIVAARQGHLLATSFHPELNDSLAVHRFFIQMAQANSQ